MGGFATISVGIKTLYINFFYQHGRFVNMIHMGEGFAHFMRWEPFISEKNKKWVSYIITAQSLQELISKVHNPRGLHECWKCSCTWMKKNGVGLYEV